MDDILENVVKDITTITELSEKLGESTKELYNLSKYMKNVEKSAPTNTVFANYGIVSHFAANLKQIAEAGGHSELYRFINRVGKKYQDALDATSKKLRHICMREIFAENALNILNLSTFRENLIEYSTAMRKAPETIDLYISIIQEVQISLDDYINTKPPNYKIIREADFILQDIIDKDKNYFMGNTHIKHIKNMISLNNFCFIPTTSAMPIGALVESTTERPLKKQITMKELKNYAAANSYVFILLWHVANSTVAYNLQNLFKRAVNASNKYGINKDLIDKTNTIDLRGDAKWQFDYDIVGNYDIPASRSKKDASDASYLMNTYFVYETIDGRLWRNLEPWPYPRKAGLPYYRVRNLLDYLTRGLDSRINNYQNAAIQKSLPNMFLPRQMPMEDINLKSQSVVDNVSIIRAILYDLVTLFNKTSSNGKKIKKNDDLLKIINDMRIDHAISTRLISMYKKSVTLTDAAFPISEIIVTYINDLKKTARAIIREMNNYNDRSPLKDFEGAAPQRYYEDMIRLSLEYVISSKANIYQNMQYKAFMLEFGL